MESWLFRLRHGAFWPAAEVVFRSAGLMALGLGTRLAVAMAARTGGHGPRPVDILRAMLVLALASAGLALVLAGPHVLRHYHRRAPASTPGRAGSRG